MGYNTQSYRLSSGLSSLFLIIAVFTLLILVFIVTRVHISKFRDGQIVDAVVGGQTYKLEVAKSDSARARGLSNRTALDSQSGMLFVFDSDGYYAFWMKNTLIPLQILWLDSNFRVVDKKLMAVEQNPSSPQKTYTPQPLARYAIEINPLSENNDINLGGKINISY